MAILSGDYSVNKGAVAENIVAECLVKADILPRTYRKNSGANRMELDFVIELGTDLAVIEVRSGKHRESPSLQKISDAYHVDRKIMLADGNIYTDTDGVEHYPLFAAAFIRDLVITRDGFDEYGFPVNGIL